MHRSEIEDGILREVRHVLPDIDAPDIAWTSRLRDLGADSIDRVEILQGIIRRFGLRIGLADIAVAADLAELADIVGGAAGA